jgi:hypothetical protein
MGGLLYGENSGLGHFGTLTWDKVRGDQTIGFRHLESDNGAYQTGVEMWQQPNIPGDVLQARLDSVSRIADEAARRAARGSGCRSPPTAHPAWSSWTRSARWSGACPRSPAHRDSEAPGCRLISAAPTAVPADGGPGL